MTEEEKSSDHQQNDLESAPSAGELPALGERNSNITDKNMINNEHSSDSIHSNMQHRSGSTSGHPSSQTPFGMTEISTAQANDMEETINIGDDDDDEQLHIQFDTPLNLNTSQIDMDSSRKKRRKKEKEVEMVPAYTDEELEEAYRLFIKKKELPAFLMRDSVLDYARRQSLKHMVVEDYDSAFKNDLIVNNLLLEYSRDSGGFVTDTAARNIESRIASAQKQKQYTNQQYHQRLNEMKEREQTKLQNLMDTQEQERVQFEANCTKPEFLQKFSKPSTRLLQMRKIQRQLAIAHEFEKAKMVKLQADQLQRDETAVAKRRAVECIKKNYAQLLERQQTQLECAKQNSDRKIMALENQMEKELEANRNLARGLESKLQETKQKKSCLPPLQASPAKAQPKGAFHQMQTFKKKEEVTQLNLNLTNIHNLMSTIKPPTSKPFVQKK